MSTTTTKKSTQVGMVLTILAMIVAIGLMSWPWIAQQITASGIMNEVTSAESASNALSSDTRKEYMRQAQAYNAQIARDQGIGSATGPDVEPIWRYEKQLTYQHDPMMSVVEIPAINVALPIYHGTTADTLMNGVGHLQGTSLPIGGYDTHCVLSAHSGMAGATMFDDIRLLKKGDLIILTTLGEKIAYKVIGSEVVLPDEMDDLRVQEGKDMLTLVTCTPYGVNDHRLLVHCVRTKYTKKDDKAAHSIANRRFGVRDIAFFAAVGSAVVVVFVAAIRHARKRRKQKGKAKAQSNCSTGNNSRDTQPTQGRRQRVHRIHADAMPDDTDVGK